MPSPALLPWLVVITQGVMLFGACVYVYSQIRGLRGQITTAHEDIRKIEVATNSMKDALVAATAKSSGLEGEARGRAAEKKDRES
jgi:hypothetical protein